MKENKVGGLTLHDLKTYCRVAVIKTACTGERTNMSINRTESPETDPHKHSQMIFDKGAKTVFATNGAGTT